MEWWSGGTRLSVDRRRQLLHVPQSGSVTVRGKAGMVWLLVGDKCIEMGTPIAVKIGLELVRQGGGPLEPQDVIVLDISGFEVSLLPETAMRIGGAILRKADRVDDWQRANPQFSRRLQ